MFPIISSGLKREENGDSKRKLNIKNQSAFAPPFAKATGRQESFRLRPAQIYQGTTPDKMADKNCGIRLRRTRVGPGR